MSIAAKVYNRMILNRIRLPIDNMLRKNQAGFRTGRSCIQQIHILRRIMDGAYAQNIPLYITFIDFKKAFDSVDREMMFAILRHYGIPAKIVDAIRVLYDKSKSQVYLQGQCSELRTIRSHNRSTSRRCPGALPLHHRHRLHLQAISWRVRLPHPLG
jgi:hypothetical protein